MIRCEDLGKSFPFLSSWLVSRVGSLKAGKPRSAVTKPGMEWASCHLTSGCGSYRRGQVSCRLTTEVVVGTESLGGSGVLLVSVLFSFIVTIPLPPLLGDLYTHAPYWHICTHVGIFSRFLAGWHLSPRHRCPAISAASRLTPRLCSKLAVEEGESCPAASYPS